MPKVQFYTDEQVVQTWRVEMEVPQEVIDQGEKAIVEYIENSCESREYICLEDSHCEEAMMNVEGVEVLKEET